MEQEVLKICFRLIELGVPPSAVKPIHEWALGIGGVQHHHLVPQKFPEGRYPPGSISAIILEVMRENDLQFTQADIRRLAAKKGHHLSPSSTSLAIKRLEKEGTVKKNQMGYYTL